MTKPICESCREVAAGVCDARQAEGHDDGVGPAMCAAAIRALPARDDGRELLREIDAFPIVRPSKHSTIQYEPYTCIPESLLKQIRALLSAPTGGVADGWIPVSERTPDAQYDVLVFDGKFVGMGDCCKGHLWNSPFTGPVTHWMPLPAAPKEKP